MAGEDDLNVSDAGNYKAHTEGPPSDTHAFHNSTPAPGERTVFSGHAPPSSVARPSVSNESTLPKIPVRKIEEEERKESLGNDLTMPVVATGAVIMSFALLAGILAIGMMLLNVFGGGGDDAEPDPADDLPEEVEGIPVRKDLKSK